MNGHISLFFENKKVTQTYVLKRNDFYKFKTELIFNVIDYLDDNLSVFRAQSSWDVSMDDVENNYIIKTELENLVANTNNKLVFSKLDKRSVLDGYFKVDGMIGFYKFVTHSDVDGYHSVGDLYDIVGFFTMIRPKLNDKDIIDDLIRLFTDAMSAKKIINYA